MMILMIQTNILHLYLLSRVQMGPQQWLKQNLIKKKNCSHGKVAILMKYFLQESKNQTYHSKV